MNYYRKLSKAELNNQKGYIGLLVADLTVNDAEQRGFIKLGLDNRIVFPTDIQFPATFSFLIGTELISKVRLERAHNDALVGRVSVCYSTVSPNQNKTGIGKPEPVARIRFLFGRNFVVGDSDMFSATDVFLQKGHYDRVIDALLNVTSVYDTSTPVN